MGRWGISGWGDAGMRGKLFSFEGLDGVGKTTQIALVRAWLESTGRDVEVVHEPGGTPVGEGVRRLVLHEAEIEDGRAELLLFAAARAELVTTRIRPALARGAVVLADRYVDSSDAYQGWGRGIDRAFVLAVNRAVAEGAWPDGTVWLDGPVHAGAKLRDNMEVRNQAFFDRARAGFAALCAREPSRARRIDASRSPGEVFQEIRDLIQQWLGI